MYMHAYDYIDEEGYCRNIDKIFNDLSQYHYSYRLFSYIGKYNMYDVYCINVYAPFRVIHFEIVLKFM